MALVIFLVLESINGEIAIFFTVVSNGPGEACKCNHAEFPRDYKFVGQQNSKISAHEIENPSQ
jgi:hypothetical protein